MFGGVANCLRLLPITVGFFSKELDGYEDGFPIVFENTLSARGTFDMWHYIHDGNYLDKQVKQRIIIVYSSPARHCWYWG